MNYWFQNVLFGLLYFLDGCKLSRGTYLKYYLRVPKTVTREEAYKGGQELQTYFVAYFLNMNLHRVKLNVHISRQGSFGTCFKVESAFLAYSEGQLDGRSRPSIFKA